MQTQSQAALFRRLPSVDDLLRSPPMAATVATEGQAAVADGLRVILARLRDAISAGTLASNAALDTALGGLTEALAEQLRQSLAFSLAPVINATGVILHTNLGRAPLSAKAIKRIAEVAGGYSNLELDLETGERGRRDLHVQRLFARLLDPAPQLNPQLRASAGSGTPPIQTSAIRNPEIQTIVVNNCAAAVMLALNSLAEGGEVIVSRGELVEIGGSFRVPEIMAKAGAVLREVGTTNRTRLADYERAINERTRLLLRVHRSNFAIVGFTEQPALEELTALGKRFKLPVCEDLGGGALIDSALLGIKGESTVSESLRAGVDVVTYSGDKLLGGPQAGMLSGRKELIARIRSNPMFRALRVDKLTYAALEATLMAYVRRDQLAIPALRMMHLSVEEIGRRASLLAERLVGIGGLRAGLQEGESLIGGGAAPSASLPTVLVSVTHARFPADELAARMRFPSPGEIPIIARIEDNLVLIDLRTVSPDHDSTIAARLAAIAQA